jgi:hypothetical protein
MSEYDSSLTVLTAELNSLPTNALALSSASGAQGLFRTSAPVRTVVSMLSLGGVLATPSANLTLDGWLLRSFDRVTFEYGKANGNLAATVAQVSNLPDTSGIYFDSGVPAQGTYVFDLTTPANLLPATYVAGIPSATAVTLSSAAVVNATNDLFAFVNPPARSPDFTILFEVRPYMSGEVVSSVPVDLVLPEGMHFKMLLKNRLGVTLPSAGNTLTLGFVPDALAVELGRWGESPGLVRVLGRGSGSSHHNY